MSGDTLRTRTGSGVLTDTLRKSPVDRWQLRARRILFWGLLLVLVVWLILCAVAA